MAEKILKRRKKETEEIEKRLLEDENDNVWEIAIQNLPNQELRRRVLVMKIVWLKRCRRDYLNWDEIQIQIQKTLGCGRQLILFHNMEKEYEERGKILVDLCQQLLDVKTKQDLKSIIQHLNNDEPEIYQYLSDLRDNITNDYYLKLVHLEVHTCTH